MSSSEVRPWPGVGATLAKHGAKFLARWQAVVVSRCHARLHAYWQAKNVTRFPTKNNRTVRMKSWSSYPLLHIHSRYLSSWHISSYGPIMACNLGSTTLAKTMGF